MCICKSGQNGYLEAVRLLLDFKAKLYWPEDASVDPFFIACQEGQKEVVEYLLKFDVDINKRRPRDLSSPIFIASQIG